MKRKITAALIIAAMLTMSACSGGAADSGTTTAATSVSASDTTVSGADDGGVTDTGALSELIRTAPLYPVSTVESAVVSQLTDESAVESPENFRIKYNDFAVEYGLQMYGSGIDEAAAENAEYCNQLRRDVIDYLVEERISLHKAAELGFTPAALTQTDCDAIIASAENAKSAGLDRFAAAAAEALGEGYTDEQLAAKKQELLDEFLAQYGFTSDIYYIWERNGYLCYKLDESLIQDITVEESEIQALVDESAEAAKKAYEEDISTYENSSVYTAVYVPEGSRSIRHILLNFEMTTVTEILTLRNNGDNDGAAALRDKTYEENLKTRAEEIIALLDSGKEFTEVQSEYNEDTLGSTDFVVVPGATTWPDEFYETAMSLENIGDYSGIVVSDFGVHILCYMSDARVTEEGLEAVCESASEYLIYQKQSELITAKTAEWAEEMPSTVDYAALDITVSE